MRPTLFFFLLGLATLAGPAPSAAGEWTAPRAAGLASPRPALAARSGETPIPRGAAPRPSSLAARCRAWASEPRNPWALAHGMVLDGRGFRARDGRPAAEVILEDFLHKAPAASPGSMPARDSRTPGAAMAEGTFAAPGGHRPGDLYFDAQAPDGTPVEPHPALHLKTLLLSGYPLSQRFGAAGGPVTVRELVEDLKLDFPPSQANSPEGAWALDALSQALKPGATFRSRAGAVVRFDAVMEAALATLEEAHAELAAGMKARRPEVPKRRQGIYAHPCGGLHFFQAVAGWARHPPVRRAWRKRLDAQVEVLLYRLDSEARQYESALAAAPHQRLPLLAQMLKFYGHLLETLGRYRDDTGWRPTEAQLRTVERARTYLEGTVRRLEEAGAFQGVEAPAVKERQLALDLIGDTCHAARGEALWSTGAR